jgi:hypothetical protein
MPGSKPGPKPNPAKPHSKYRASPIIDLPAECNLPAPKLPSGRKWTAPERALWKELWSSPQASQWDDSYASIVALYVVNMVEMLGGEWSAWRSQECRHLADRLGLSPAGLIGLGWRLPDAPDVAPSLTVLHGGFAS